MLCFVPCTLSIGLLPWNLWAMPRSWTIREGFCYSQGALGLQRLKAHLWNTEGPCYSWGRSPGAFWNPTGPIAECLGFWLTPESRVLWRVMCFLCISLLGDFFFFPWKHSYTVGSTKPSRDENAELELLLAEWFFPPVDLTWDKQLSVMGAGTLRMWGTCTLCELYGTLSV